MLARPILLYDGHCAFCRRWVERFKRWDRKRKIDFVPSQQRDRISGLPPISDSALDRAMHLVLPEGTVLSGGRALRAILRYLPGGPLLGAAFLIPGVPALTNRGYDWVAARRHRFGCGDTACGYVSAHGGDHADSRDDS